MSTPQRRRSRIGACSQSIPSVFVPLVRQLFTPDPGVYVNRSTLNTPAELTGKMRRHMNAAQFFSYVAVK